MAETCTIKITVADGSDEDWVKNAWPYMQPWFTRRHGVESGKIELNGGAVAIEWRYQTDQPESEE